MVTAECRAPSVSSSGVCGSNGGGRRCRRSRGPGAAGSGRGWPGGTCASRGRRRGRATCPIRPWWRSPAHRGGRGSRLEDPAEVDLSAAVRGPVVVGEVEMGDAQVESSAQDGTLGVEGRPSPKFCHRTKRHGGEEQAAAPTAAIASSMRTGRPRGDSRSPRSHPDSGSSTLSLEWAGDRRHRGGHRRRRDRNRADVRDHCNARRQAGGGDHRARHCRSGGTDPHRPAGARRALHGDARRRDRGAPGVRREDGTGAPPEQASSSRRRRCFDRPDSRGWEVHRVAYLIRKW